MSREEIPAYIQAWQEESWTAHGGTSYIPDIHMYVDYCRFVDGKHVDPGRNCPHDNVMDEMGPIMPVGWTALDN